MHTNLRVSEKFLKDYLQIKKLTNWSGYFFPEPSLLGKRNSHYVENNKEHLREGKDESRNWRESRGQGSSYGTENDIIIN